MEGGRSGVFSEGDGGVLVIRKSSQVFSKENNVKGEGDSPLGLVIISDPTWKRKHSV